MSLEQKWATVIEVWTNRLTEERSKHENDSRRYQILHYGFGISAAILSAVTGASFLVIASVTMPSVKWGLGICGILSSCLISIQTLARFAARYNKHRTAAACCSSLVRMLDFTKMRVPRSWKEAEDRIASINSRIEEMELDTIAELRFAVEILPWPPVVNLREELLFLVRREKCLNGLGPQLWELAERAAMYDKTADQYIKDKLTQYVEWGSERVKKGNIEDPSSRK